MPSRSVRRRRHKQATRELAFLADLTDHQKVAVGRNYLLGWRKEARRRAGSPEAAAVWDLARDSQTVAVAVTLDPSGELHADLTRVCAETVASQVGGRLVSASRPSADRTRRGV